MGNRNINNKEQKKKKKTDAASTAKPSLGTVVAQPEIVKKHRKSEEE
jgi:hypothetical protein